MAGADLPSRAIREQITSALDLVVHVRRYEDGVRRIASISEVTGIESGTPLLQDIFVFRVTGQTRGRVKGSSRPPGSCRASSTTSARPAARSRSSSSLRPAPPGRTPETRLMLDLLLALALIALVAALVNAVLPGRGEDADDEGGRAMGERAVAIEIPWAAIASGAIAAMVLLVMELPLSVVLAVAFLMGMVCHVVLRALAARREMAFELALAASLDLVVASLRSGAALVTSPRGRDAGSVGDMLSELCDRLRLGEPPARSSTRCPNDSPRGSRLHLHPRVALRQRRQPATPGRVARAIRGSTSCAARVPSPSRPRPRSSGSSRSPTGSRS